MLELDLVQTGEAGRLAALRRYQEVPSLNDKALAHITDMACEWLQMPISAISLVGEDTIQFRARRRLIPTQVPRVAGFCNSAIQSPYPYAVGDIASRPDLFAHPVLKDHPKLRSYAAAPLRTIDQYSIGALFCMDERPRALAAREMKLLSNLARVAMDQMHMHLVAHRLSELQTDLDKAQELLRNSGIHDKLTQVLSRDAIIDNLARSLVRARRNDEPVGVMLIDVDHHADVSACFSAAAADRVLKEVAGRLHHCIRGSDCIGRLGGESFLAVLYGCEAEMLPRVADRCLQSVRKLPVTLTEDPPCDWNPTISIGALSSAQKPGADIQALIRAATDALLAAKEDGGDAVRLAPDVMEPVSERVQQ